jgi:hypothetical protein
MEGGRPLRSPNFAPDFALPRKNERQLRVPRIPKAIAQATDEAIALGSWRFAGDVIANALPVAQREARAIRPD